MSSIDKLSQDANKFLSPTLTNAMKNDTEKHKGISKIGKGLKNIGEMIITKLNRMAHKIFGKSQNNATISKRLQVEVENLTTKASELIDKGDVIVDEGALSQLSANLKTANKILEKLINSGAKEGRLNIFPEKTKTKIIDDIKQTLDELETKITAKLENETKARIDEKTDKVWDNEIELDLNKMPSHMKPQAESSQSDNFYRAQGENAKQSPVQQGSIKPESGSILDLKKPSKQEGANLSKETPRTKKEIDDKEIDELDAEVWKTISTSLSEASKDPQYVKESSSTVSAEKAVKRGKKENIALRRWEFQFKNLRDNLNDKKTHLENMESKEILDWVDEQNKVVMALEKNQPKYSTDLVKKLGKMTSELENIKISAQLKSSKNIQKQEATKNPVVSADYEHEKEKMKSVAPKSSEVGSTLISNKPDMSEAAVKIKEKKIHELEEEIFLLEHSDVENRFGVNKNLAMEIAKRKNEIVSLKAEEAPFSLSNEKDFDVEMTSKKTEKSLAESAILQAVVKKQEDNSRSTPLTSRALVEKVNSKEVDDLFEIIGSLVRQAEENDDLTKALGLGAHGKPSELNQKLMDLLQRPSWKRNDYKKDFSRAGEALALIEEGLIKAKKANRTSEGLGIKNEITKKLYEDAYDLWHKLNETISAKIDKTEQMLKQPRKKSDVEQEMISDAAPSSLTSDKKVARGMTSQSKPTNKVKGDRANKGSEKMELSGRKIFKAKRRLTTEFPTVSQKDILKQEAVEQPYAFFHEEPVATQQKAAPAEVKSHSRGQVSSELFQAMEDLDALLDKAEFRHLEKITQIKSHISKFRALGNKTDQFTDVLENSSNILKSLGSLIETFEAPIKAPFKEAIKKFQQIGKLSEYLKISVDTLDRNQNKQEFKKVIKEIQENNQQIHNVEDFQKAQMGCIFTLSSLGEEIESELGHLSFATKTINDFNDLIFVSKREGLDQMTESRAEEISEGLHKVMQYLPEGRLKKDLEDVQKEMQAIKHYEALTIKKMENVVSLHINKAKGLSRKLLKVPHLKVPPLKAEAERYLTRAKEKIDEYGKAGYFLNDKYSQGISRLQNKLAKISESAPIESSSEKLDKTTSTKKTLVDINKLYDDMKEFVAYAGEWYGLYGAMGGHGSEIHMKLDGLLSNKDPNYKTKIINAKLIKNLIDKGIDILRKKQIDNGKGFDDTFKNLYEKIELNLNELNKL